MLAANIAHSTAHGGRRTAPGGQADWQDAAQRALALSEAGRHADALPLLTHAVGRHPGQIGLLLPLGTVLLRLGQAEQAVGALLLGAETAPDHPGVLSALGVAFLQIGALDLARHYGGRAYTIAPTHETAVNFSRILLEAGAWEEALAASQHAVRLRPDSLLGRNNHALALEGLGRYEDAVQAWRDALAAAPDDPDLLHKLATLLLSLGRLTAETWALYEGRLGRAAGIGAIRRWHGEDVAGKTILLHAEQGLGDTMQFVRYAPLVAGRGARVILAVQPALARLLGTTPGVDQLVAVGGRLPAFDMVCPIMSLPAIFGTTLATVPPPLPYSLPRRGRPPGPLRVGLVWAGNPGFVNDRRRSIPPDLLLPLTRTAGATFYSLQFGQDAPAEMRLHRLMDGVTDFADTADRIADLDLVIAVDTAVAHLAATMGKPVWLLSRFMGCWRWLQDRADSPWYPTMRIYRQARANDWTDLLQHVGQNLRDLAAG